MASSNNQCGSKLSEAAVATPSSSSDPIRGLPIPDPPLGMLYGLVKLLALMRALEETAMSLSVFRCTPVGMSRG